MWIIQKKSRPLFKFLKQARKWVLLLKSISAQLSLLPGSPLWPSPKEMKPLVKGVPSSVDLFFLSLESLQPLRSGWFDSSLFSEDMACWGIPRSWPNGCHSRRVHRGLFLLLQRACVLSPILAASSQNVTALYMESRGTWEVCHLTGKFKSRKEMEAAISEGEGRGGYTA